MKRGNGAERGDGSTPPSQLKANQRSTKDNAADLCVEMADPTAQEKQNADSARMRTALANEEYPQKNTPMIEQILLLQQANMDRNKIVEPTKESLSPEDFMRCKLILSLGDGASGGYTCQEK